MYQVLRRVLRRRVRGPVLPTMKYCNTLVRYEESFFCTDLGSQLKVEPSHLASPAPLCSCLLSPPLPVTARHPALRVHRKPARVQRVRPQEHALHGYRPTSRPSNRPLRLLSHTIQLFMHCHPHARLPTLAGKTVAPFFALGGGFRWGRKKRCSCSRLLEFCSRGLPKRQHSRHARRAAAGGSHAAPCAGS
jgi:hypothetical protein